MTRCLDTTPYTIEEMYAFTGSCLDACRLFSIPKAERPLWTQHFCTWEGFKSRVKEALCDGDPTSLWSAHGWYSDADLERAKSEIQCRVRVRVRA